MNKEVQVRKIVMKRIKNFKKYVAFSFILAIIIQLLNLIPPLVMKQIIDVYLVEKQMKYTMTGIIVCVVVPLISTLITTFYNYKLNAVGRNMGAELTLLASEKLVYQPISFFQDKKSSELASYCSSESMKYIVFWLFDMPELVASLLSGVIIYLYILNTSVISGIILLLYIPIMLIPSNYFAKKAQSLIRQVVKNNGTTAQLLNDTFRGIKFVKASVLEKHRLKKIHEVNENTVSVWTKMVVLDNLSGMWTNSIVDKLFTGIVFGVIAISIMMENATVGMLLILLNYLPILFDVVRKVANTNFKFKKQLAEYDKLFELIVMPDEREQMNGNKKFAMNHGITAENISFRYSEDSPFVLNNLSLFVKKGEWVGIIGESGAGKSTLFQLLIRLYNLTSGCIRIDDTSIENIDVYELRRQISFVSQDTFLFPGTIRDNLAIMNPNASDKEMEEVLCQVGLESLLSRENGLNCVLGENGMTLSGGQKQRIGLAQGLLRGSQILLLDEVTANVDNKLEEDIRKLIHHLKEERGLTVISISHRINFLDYADRIYELKDGKVQIQKSSV